MCVELAAEHFGLGLTRISFDEDMSEKRFYIFVLSDLHL